MCTSCETSTLYLILTWGFVCVCHVKPTHFTSFWLEVLYVCNVKPTHFTSFWLEVLRVSCKTHFTSFWLEVLYVCHECEISTLYIILIWGFVCVSWMWNQHTLHHFDLRFCMCVMNVKSAHFTSFWFEVLYVCHECEISTLYIILTWGFVCVSWMWNQHTLHHFDLRFCMCVMNVKSAHFTSFWFEALYVCVSCETSTHSVHWFDREAVTAVVLTKSVLNQEMEPMNVNSPIYADRRKPQWSQKDNLGL